MTILRVPYHMDEYLPDLDLPLKPAQLGSAQTITAELPAGDTWARLTVLYRPVADAVARAVGDGRRPVVLSGDCTTSLGIVAGLQHAGLDPGIVWFDAHGDVQTLETTASGYLGGLPLRLLAGYRPELIAGGLGLRPVPEHQIVLVGARDLDPPEVTYLAGAAIGRVEVAALTSAGLPSGPLYVHLDLDVIDPAILPGLKYPAPGGAALADVAGALGRLLATGRVAAMGIACTWSPGHDAAARVAPLVGDVLVNL
jgi:arginase